ncbi:hypothetical protein PAXRUDRAFT_149472, partial [Paxillus rubicundulus Ve08.2h10]
KMFHVGSNSSCQQHICGHYELYQQWCASDKFVENHHVVLCGVIEAWKAVDK